MEYIEVAPGMVEVKSVVDLSPERKVKIVEELLKNGTKTVVINGQIINKNTISKLYGEKKPRITNSTTQAIDDAVTEMFERS